MYSNIGKYFKHKTPEELTNEAWENLSKTIKQQYCKHKYIVIDQTLKGCSKCFTLKDNTYGLGKLRKRH